MARKRKQRSDYVAAIQASALSIYDEIEVGSPLWIPSPDLEVILNKGLQGLKTSGVPLRTRSKLVKQKVCEALGYPIPQFFKKCQPRFPGQNFDTYVQRSNNLQIWNEGLSPIRRYVLIRENEQGVVSCVKVITGADLSQLDKTGTLTQKYQARFISGEAPSELISSIDTGRLQNVVSSVPFAHFSVKPTDYPSSDSLLSIFDIFERLKMLVGKHSPARESIKSEIEAQHCIGSFATPWAMRTTKMTDVFRMCGISF